MTTDSLPAIVAVVGLTGAGKSEATAILQRRWGYAPVYFGGVVVDEVKHRGWEVTPDNERHVREELRANEGMDAIARRSLPAVRSRREAGEKVVIDGLYSSAERTLLVSELGPDLVILAVHAARVVRKDRLAHRPVRPLTPEQVDARDRFEVENLDKAGPIALADLHVVNDTTVENLEQALVRALDLAGAARADRA